MHMEEAQPTRVPTIRPVSVEVDFDTFVESDMRACKVLACEPVKKSNRLLRYVLDDGSGAERTIISGILKWLSLFDTDLLLLPKVLA